MLALLGLVSSGLLDNCWLGGEVTVAWVFSREWLLECVLHRICGVVSVQAGNDIRHRHQGFRMPVGWKLPLSSLPLHSYLQSNEN